MRTRSFLGLTLLFVLALLLVGLIPVGGFWLHFLAGMALGGIYGWVALAPFLFDREEF